MLVSDLEEIEFYVQQRIAELQSKEQAIFDCYSNAGDKSELERKFSTPEEFQAQLKVIRGI